VRSFTTSGAPGRCPRCLILQAQCICASVPTVATRTEVLIVRHEREGWKSTGTARIAQLAMPNLRIVEYGEDAEPAKSALPAEVVGAHLLFPGDDAVTLSPAASSDEIRRLIVIDGTWRQTRKMFSKLPALHGVPKVQLSGGAAKVLRLRESKFEEGRSTLEAIAEAVEMLEGRDVAAPLYALHSNYVERVFRARGVWEHRSGQS
jgi:DTW domain-containing protein YfiP